MIFHHGFLVTSALSLHVKPKSSRCSTQHSSWQNGDLDSNNQPGDPLVWWEEPAFGWGQVMPMLCYIMALDKMKLGYWSRPLSRVESMLMRKKGYTCGNNHGTIFLTRRVEGTVLEGRVSQYVRSLLETYVYTNWNWNCWMARKTLLDLEPLDDTLKHIHS